MACGTGKTLTSLKIAEQMAGKNKLVLFLVPSLSLLSQTLTEWTQQSGVPLHSFAVCSDAEVGKKRNKDEDVVEVFTHELRYPATTDARRLAEEVKKRHDAQHMSVIFSTYHSLDVISRAQLEYGLPDFQLVICDEAHRTTGATFDSESEPRRRRKRTTSRCARWMMRCFTASSFTSSRHRATVYSVEKRISNRAGEWV